MIHSTLLWLKWPVVWKCGDDFYPRVLDGVDECQFFCIERYLAAFVRAGRTVLLVADDRMSHRRQLGADLMGETGDERHLQQRQRRLCIDNPIFELCGFAVRCDTSNPRGPVLEESMGEVRFFLSNTALDDGVIDFVGGAVPKLGGESSGRLGGLGDHHRAAHGPVEPMNEPQIDIARLVVSFFYYLLYQGEDIEISGQISLAEQAGRLVHDNNVVVFVKDG